jgi:hypothetical protein
MRCDDRMSAHPPSNSDIADVLSRIADLLEAQGASMPRVRAWRLGAAGIRAEPRPVHEIFRADGRVGLEAIAHVGERLANVVIELLRTGRTRVLDRLEGEIAPADVFAGFPGISDELAARIHDVLAIETLEELGRAAADGRLAALDGFGAVRARAVREVLAGRLTSPVGHALDLPVTETPHLAPPVALLLDTDSRYREQALAGRLRRIAPRRFNPGNDAWLPILHEDVAGWSLTALFSNTALAHELAKTADWVVVYYERNGAEGRATIVTETHGPLRGRRVVRGRETETAALVTPRVERPRRAAP